MLRYLFLLVLAVLSATPASAQLNPTETQALRRAIDRGTLLYYYDQAAWHGTDDMLAKIGSRKDEIGGWIVDGPVEASELIFFDRNANEPHALYVARFALGKLQSGRVLGADEDRTLSPARRQMVAALLSGRSAVAQSGLTPCGNQPFNTVLLPPETPGGPTNIYFLTPQPARDAYAFGGNFALAIGADGKAGPMRRFTNSCLTMKAPPSKKGKDPAALIVTHLLDPVPTEIHVFTAYAARVPIVVMTGKDRLWAIDIQNGRAHITSMTMGGKN